MSKMSKRTKYGSGGGAMAELDLAAIKKLAELAEHSSTYWHENSKLTKVETILRIVARCEAAEAERWIPVSERLPILYSSALIAHNETRNGKATVEEAQYVGSDEYGQWCLVRTLRDDESIYLTEQVTHWQPLPEPPALAAALAGQQ